MAKTSIATLALAAFLAVPAFAQSAAPAAAPAATAAADPIVQARAERRAARQTYAQGKKAADANRKAKVSEALAAAAKDPANKDKDPLVVKRDAKAKAMKATKGDYDAKLKALADTRKQAVAAAETKIMVAK